jgi:hypothetical protein
MLLINLIKQYGYRRDKGKFRREIVVAGGAMELRVLILG